MALLSPTTRIWGLANGTFPEPYIVEPPFLFCNVQPIYKFITLIWLLSNWVLPVSTVKFDLKDDLEELQARLYLDTRKRLTKKEVLEIAFRVGLENYDLIVKEIQTKEQPLDDDLIQKILSLVEDLGPGSEDLSSKVDEILYGGS